ncbi:MAG: hypothetical protein KBF21_10540 [Thermoanaerobaculia bacterium]|nr:hypothetical protein [Thermoanaerobaculia bacterium]MBP9824648.1 hypothetical protein [Thermoanaerobaculia bacterium]
MLSVELENLVRVGRLKREPVVREEYEGLIRNAARRLEDAGNDRLHAESRFDLAYSAAHSVAGAALRRLGYRASDRQVVFQALAHTLGTSASTWRVLAKCHEQRNRRDYEGMEAIDERLLRDLLTAAAEILREIQDRGELETT